MKLKTIPIISAAGGIIILGLFIILEIVRSPADKDLLKRTPLTPGTAEWSRWLKRTATWSVYLFNTTNPHQVALGAKPKLQEFGPYVYQVTETKSKVQYHELTETVSYAVSTAIRFMPAESIGSEDDEFTILNLPLIHLAWFDLGEAQEALRNQSDEKLFLTWTVAEMVHKGKHSHIFRAYMDSNLWSYEYMNRDYGLYILETELSYMYNETSEVKTGNAHSLDEIGELTRSPGAPNSSGQGACGELRGTDGTIFPPGIKKDTKYFVYSLDWFRLYFRYVKATTVDGISGFRFELPKELLEYPGNSNETSCYCKTSDLDWDHHEDEVKCPYDGTIGLPGGFSSDFILSLPHFLHGAPKLHTMVEGMHPDPQRHQSYFELEPQSGLILSSHLRIQLNLDLLNASELNISHVSNISETVYPILWFDRHITDLHDPSLKRALLPNGESVGDAVLGSSKWLLCIVGVVMVLGSVLFILHVRYCGAVQEDQNNVALLPSRFSAAVYKDCSVSLNNDEEY